MYSAALCPYRNYGPSYFGASYKKEVHKVEKVRVEIAEIWKSLGVENVKLDFSCPKVLMRDTQTRELIGYASVTELPDTWVVTQLAVMKAFQRKGNGTRILKTILKKALYARLKQVIFETNRPIQKFYKNVANERIQCVIETNKVTFTLGNLAEGIFKAISGVDKIPDNTMRVYFPQDGKEQIEDLYELYHKIKDHPHLFNVLTQIFLNLKTSSRKNYVSGLFEMIRSTNDQQMKIDFAKAMASSNYKFRIIKELATLGIERENDRVEIIKIVIRDCNYLDQFFDNFKTFGITNPKLILELGKIAANISPDLTLCNLNVLNIPGFHHFVFESLLKHLNKKLKPTLTPYEILVWLANTQGRLAAAWAPYSGITNQEDLAHIAAIALKESWLTGCSFSKFGIRDEATRIALFKQFSNKDLFNIIEFDINEQERIKLAIEYAEKVPFSIKFIKISREEDRIEIAKTAASRSEQFSRKIKKFKIKSEATRIELALIVLKHYPEQLCRFFKNFEITDETIRFEFAQKLIQSVRKDYYFDNYISEFKIISEVRRFELAMLAAKQGVFGPSPNLYKITNPDLLLSLAKTAAQKSPPFYVAENIYCFRIEDEKNRIEIAEIIAQKPRSNISAWIHAFCIHDQSALKRIALHAAENDPENVAINIEKYGLIQEKDRIDIAFASVPYSCKTFKNFQITDDNVLEKLIFLSIEHSVNEVIKLINFTDEKLRFEFAKKCALYNGQRTIKHIGNFNFTYLEQDLEIAWLSLRHSIESDTKLEHLSRIATLHADIKCKDDITKELQELKCKYEICFPAGDLYSAIGDDKQQARWLTFAIGCCYIQDLSREELDWMAPHMKKILPLSDLQTKFKLVDVLARIAKSPNQRTIFDRIETKSIFSAILVTPLIAIGIDPVLIEKLQRVQYKELLRIIYECSYTSEEYTRILQYAFRGDVRKALMMIEHIIQLGGTSVLKQPIEDLEAILLNLFRKKIPIKSIENFYERFTKVLSTFKVPELLYTYAGKMSELKDPPALAALATFVENLLEGTYKEERYKNSLHLDTVFKGREAQFLEWKKGLSRPFEDLNLSNTLKTNFAEKYWNLIDVHKHLDLKRFPYIQSFFDKDPDVLRKLGAAIKDTKKGLTPEAHALLFQRHFIRLMKPELNVFEQKTELKMMFEYLGNCEGIHELKSDIENDLKSYEKITHNYEGWTVEDCDDPESLFTCGNVGGSCQRIDGSGDLNKHLLGYVLDGKNRLLCVKDQQGNLIARCIFRILWDAGKQTPVLFMEQVYPSTALPNVRQNIFNLAKNRAAALNLPLTWAKEPDGEAYNGTIESLSGKGPYEYADAAINHQTSGVFSITNPLK